MTYIIKTPKLGNQGINCTSGLNIEPLYNGEIALISVFKEGSRVREWKVCDLSADEESKLLNYLLKRKKSVTELPAYANIRRSLYLSKRTVFTGVSEPVTLGLVREPPNGQYIPVVFYQDDDDTHFHRYFDTMEAAIAFIEAAPNPLTDKWLDEVFYGTEWS